MRYCIACNASDQEDCKNSPHDCEFGDSGVITSKEFFELKFQLAVARNLVNGIDLDFYSIAWNEDGRKAIKEYKKAIGWKKQDMKKF